FAVMFLMTITVMILSKKVTQIESLALCAIATARLLPIANGYTNAVFLVPLFFLLGHGNENHLSRRNLAVVLFLSVSTMSFQVPIGGGFPSDSVYTYNALVGPVLSLVFVATIGFRLLLHPAHRVLVLSSRVAKSSD
ncbi:MAG: hypothetical protein KGQ60_08115, partial [Planctomycetes bacterium]|nr:hypothetical protein [Planctomycetota bacterium]